MDIDKKRLEALITSWEDKLKAIEGKDLDYMPCGPSLEAAYRTFISELKGLKS